MYERGNDYFRYCEGIGDRSKNRPKIYSLSQSPSDPTRRENWKKLHMFVKPTVPIIDEMGYLKLGSEQRSLLISSDHPSIRTCLIILTSSKRLGEWGKIERDLATAMLNRLLHHSIIFNLRGKAIGYKKNSNKKNRGINMVLLGNFMTFF